NSTSRRRPPETAPSAEDLSRYESACLADPRLRSFDSGLRERAGRAIDSIAVGSGGDDVRCLPLESLSQVTECLMEMNQEVVKIILQSRRGIWKNKELSDLVDDYFDTSLRTLDFCTALESCLRRAAHIESIINVALHKFREESSGENGGKYAGTLAELKKFRTAGDPFAGDFFKVFNSVSSGQISMLERLNSRKRKLDKKLANLKTYRRISSVIFITAFAAVLVCSVVAAALTAPPALTA
ncbi:hypothetical protein M569_01016, partial [Genlisea aurea]